MIISYFRKKIMKRALFIFFLIKISFLSSQNKIIELWDVIPNHIKTNEKEIVSKTDIIRIKNVIKPTIEVFLPAKQNATGGGVLICPGGGYEILAYDWEGTDIAKWFNSKGIAAFVLKYRLPNSKSVKVSYKAPLQDAQRAMRIIRNNHREYNIDKDKIGVMGFSAGGHLASTLGTQFNKPNDFTEKEIDKISAKPNFMILIYPVISMKNNITHMGSKNNLLGLNPSDSIVSEFSNELQVNELTPRTFLLHSQDDMGVPVENSLVFYKSLKKHKIPSEMNLYSYGGHGYSFAIGKGHLQNWPERLHQWIIALDN